MTVIPRQHNIAEFNLDDNLDARYRVEEATHKVYFLVVRYKLFYGIYSAPNSYRYKRYLDI